MHDQEERKTINVVDKQVFIEILMSLSLNLCHFHSITLANHIVT